MTRCAGSRKQIDPVMRPAIELSLVAGPLIVGRLCAFRVLRPWQPDRKLLQGTCDLDSRYLHEWHVWTWDYFRREITFARGRILGGSPDRNPTIL